MQAASERAFIIYISPRLAALLSHQDSASAQFENKYMFAVSKRKRRYIPSRATKQNKRVYYSSLIRGSLAKVSKYCR